MAQKQIYLDHAATTPVAPAVFRKMQPYFNQKYGNPSSIHGLGQTAAQAIEKARQQIAVFLNCLSEEIHFTAGATESDNWIIWGLVEKLRFQESINPHIITSAIEHKAILEPCQVLLKKGLIRLTILPVNSNGLVSLEDLKKAIKKDTRLVSIMYANSEIGTIQPISQIGQLIKKLNPKRKHPIIFHSDAVQAANYLDCSVDKLGLDSLSLSGHKVYGPKGVGLLYVKKGVKLSPLIRGGGQEKGVRSGTENVPGIIGLAEAVSRINQNNKELKKLRDKLITGVLRDINQVELNGSFKDRLPNNANFSFKGAEGESIVLSLSAKGVFTSTGSACASHSLSPSHVMLALGLSHEQAHASVRFTLGQQTTSQDIDYLLKILPGIIARLRKISGR
ncbi:MAG: cysteine desulfurase NifS [Parcubacteria group bacterium]|jgi:cysteine desulfurase|nr:cysteine desulfurase NifS [Parcubacteria group bacterium]|tara:strand:- start:5722 stop:6897 length:1176 start_codon:yes stop_codon:yes gene_type:complete